MWTNIELILCLRHISLDETSLIVVKFPLNRYYLYNSKENNNIEYHTVILNSIECLS